MASRRRRRRKVPNTGQRPVNIEEMAYVKYAEEVAPRHVEAEVAELRAWSDRIDTLLRKGGGGNGDDEGNEGSGADFCLDPAPDIDAGTAPASPPPPPLPTSPPAPAPTLAPAPPLRRRRVDWRREAAAAGAAKNLYECMMCLSRVLDEEPSARLIGVGGLTPVQALVYATVDRRKFTHYTRSSAAPIRARVKRSLCLGSEWRDGVADALAFALLLHKARHRKADAWLDEVDGRVWLEREVVFLEEMRENAFRSQAMKEIRDAVRGETTRKLPKGATTFLQAATTVGKALVRVAGGDAAQTSPSPAELLLASGTTLLTERVVRTLIDGRQSEWCNSTAPRGII